ncbi:hypothetical protein [Microbacterium deminutum]|uniref:DUF676 domain-containing protein n=1 Tax=Microbacterium deminutum TaxID=344164 RepID=A0ABN2RJU3_9MICO
MDASLKTHTLIPAPYGDRSVFFAAPDGATALVVFVHGFKGNATKTWGRFAEELQDRPWWSHSDMLFFGYDSVRRAVPGVAQELRAAIEAEYPSSTLLGQYAGELHSPPPDEYSELVLVGHSLGGVVLRRMLVDVAENLARERSRGREPEAPAILSSRLRLFAPANAGFSPSGILGVLHGLSPWTMVEAILRGSPAYNDLRLATTALTTLRQRTEEFAGISGNESLRADILWPDPDDVVSTERYLTDEREYFVRAQTHQSICKPTASFARPWRFVEGEED